MAELRTLVYTLVAITVSLALYLYNKRLGSFPVVNAYPKDYNRKKAYSCYEAGARELIATGLAQHRGPITLLTPGGPKLILPASLSDWAKASKDLDHQELVKEDFMANFPGFEAQTAIHHSNRLVINVIRSKLSKNEGALPVLKSNIVEALQQHWGEDESWHEIDWQRGTTGIISRATASIFAGPDLARDPEWQEVTTKYVLDFFTVVMQLRAWPTWLRPLAHRLNPLSRACQNGINRVREMLQEEATRRAAARASGVSYDDAIEWTTTAAAAAAGEPIDQGAVQLGLAVAAVFTTSEALRQTILELCKNADIIPELRAEIQQAISESGWTMSALFKMKLLDSVMKEGQRTLPALVGLERKAVRNTTLPDGTKIPAGTHLAVDSSLMWDANVYDAPEKFDGHRYLVLRESTGASAHAFTASSKEHNTFGMGRFMCPGRFFADVELKLCLAHMLLNYEFRLEEGYTSRPIYSGFYPLVDPVAKVEVRRVHN